MIEEITEKQLSRFERLAEERYDALRKTITHLYGQAFLEELEANVDGIISRMQLENTIQCRLRFLRRQYRTKCKVETSEQRLVEKAFYYVTYSAKDRKQSEKRALNQMLRRSKVRQRYNRLARVILRDLGETIQKELICKSKTLALADVIQKYKYQKFGWVKGYAENDLSCALRHLRILYAYTRWQREGIDGTRIHNQINNNYRNGMLDYYKNDKL